MPDVLRRSFNRGFVRCCQTPGAKILCLWSNKKRKLKGRYRFLMRILPGTVYLAPFYLWCCRLNLFYVFRKKNIEEGEGE